VGARFSAFFFFQIFRSCKYCVVEDTISCVRHIVVEHAKFKTYEFWMATKNITCIQSFVTIDRLVHIATGEIQHRNFKILLSPTSIYSVILLRRLCYTSFLKNL
jgi:hypothetical protein